VFFQRADDAMAAPHPVSAPATLPPEAATGTLAAASPEEQLRQLRLAARPEPRTD